MRERTEYEISLCQLSSSLERTCLSEPNYSVNNERILRSSLRRIFTNSGLFIKAMTEYGY